MTEILDGVAEESTLLDLQCDSGGPKCGQDLVDMRDVFIDSLREDDNVVDVH